MAVRSIAQLRGVSTEQLIQEHDAMASGPIVVGVTYFLEELRRRDQAAAEERMLAMTQRMLGMTRTITRLTIANTIFVAIAAAAAIIALR